MPATLRVYMNPAALTSAERKAAPRVLKRQGGYVRRSMSRSIQASRGAAPPGRAPFTHNFLLRSSILYAVQGADRVVIGPDYTRAGIIGHTHEFGGYERDNQIPNKRSFLFKARTNNWNLAIGGHGPIREDASKQGGFAYGKLRTANQVRRAKDNGLKINGPSGISSKARVATIGRRYPKRPFAAPTLDRVVQSGALVRMWKDTMGPGKGSSIGIAG